VNDDELARLARATWNQEPPNNLEQILEEAERRGVAQQGLAALQRAAAQRETAAEPQPLRAVVQFTYADGDVQELHITLLPQGARTDDEARAEDAALLTVLRREAFQGRAWEHFAESMARYALPIITSWIASLKIFKKCAEKGVRCPGPPLGSERLTEDDASEMAIEIVGRALNNFRDKVLRPGRWSSQAGASLTGMFLTQCIFQFPNVYRHWLQETEPLPVDDFEKLESLETPSGDPVDLVMIREELAHALEHYVKDERVRYGLLLRAMGYSSRETAYLIGTTAKALDSTLRRHRRALSRERARPGGEEAGTAP
jgi:DNA-directed RNA polymerase specialized sigma24 family protein